MGNPVVHFEITAKGVDRLHDFYGKVFGWKIDANNPFKYGMTDTGAGSGINGGIGETTGTPHVTVYIQVPEHRQSAGLRESGGRRGRDGEDGRSRRADARPVHRSVRSSDRPDRGLNGSVTVPSPEAALIRQVVEQNRLARL